MVKPFDFRELIAVIHVMTRKTSGNRSNVYEIADLRVDTAAKRVSRAGREIELTAKEYALLEYMIRNKGMVLSREQIENNLWNYKYEGGSNVVNVYIGYLRKKIDEALSRSSYAPYGASAGCSGRTENVGKAQAHGVDSVDDAAAFAANARGRIWVDKTSLIDSVQERLMETVLENEKLLSAEADPVVWDEVDFFSRGVYCAFYDNSGRLLRGLTVDELTPDDLPFMEYELRSIDVDGYGFCIYDAQLYTSDAIPVWIRGIIPASDESGAAHLVTVLTFSLLPLILILSIVGGWFMAKTSFDPIEKITRTANSIKDGSDLTQRIALKKGPAEMMALSNTFDGMFDRLETRSRRKSSSPPTPATNCAPPSPS